MEGLDPHLEAVRWAASSLRPLALRACAEMDTALSVLATVVTASQPQSCDLIFSGRRRTTHVASFFGLALGALDPYSDIAFPSSPRRLLTRYHAPGRVLLALEGGCTLLGWQARVDAERLAGVRALYMAIGAALLEDFDELSEIGPALAGQLPKRGPARRHLRAFQRGLGRLFGLIELLADAQRVVSYKTDDGRQFMDLFKSAELG